MVSLGLRFGLPLVFQFVPTNEVREPRIRLIGGEVVTDLDIGRRALAELFIESTGEVGVDERIPDALAGSSLAG